MGFRSFSKKHNINTSVTVTVTDRHVTHGHFQLRDKDGNHTIQPAVFKKPMVHKNLVALSFIEPELWSIEVYIAEIRHSGRFQLL